MIYKVHFRKQVLKKIVHFPNHVVVKLNAWQDLVENQGLEEARKIPGFHDEPVKGNAWVGQRSIRLSKGYRAFYRVIRGDQAYVLIDEVNKHEY